MIVKDELLLAEFRDRGVCELCGRRRPTQPHHVKPRGMGGGSRVDVRWNLLAVCYGLDGCHDRVQNGQAGQEECWRAIAKREGVTVDEVKAHVAEVLRAPKGSEYKDGKIIYAGAGGAGEHCGRPGVDGHEPVQQAADGA